MKVKKESEKVGLKLIIQKTNSWNPVPSLSIVNHNRNIIVIWENVK